MVPLSSFICVTNDEERKFYEIEIEKNNWTASLPPTEGLKQTIL